jgi:hypothetical protein
MKKLKLIQIHYHAKAGGVRIVMENIVHAIIKAAPRLVFESRIIAGSGHCLSMADTISEKNFNHTLIHVEDLNYSTPAVKVSRRLVLQLMQKMMAASGEISKSKDQKTVVIGHNITIGKNPVLTAAFSEWAKTWKQALFISLIHDFPEDNRSENLNLLVKSLGKGAVSQTLYPARSNLHFVVINSRDWQYMKKSGMPEKRLHYIPNMVSTGRFLPLHQFHRMEALKKLLLELETYCKKEGYRISASKKILLYPVRAIRRKNMLEALLLTYLLGRDSWQLWIGLNPTGGLDLHFWNGIKKILPDFSLDIVAGFADMIVHNKKGDSGITLNEQYNIADLIITTSVQEGFGYTYHEGWLAGKPVVGRAIPKNVADFERRGMDLKHLYKQIMVPVSWIDFKEITRKYLSKIKVAGIGKKGTELKKMIEKAKTHHGLIDFADLDIENQIRVLYKINRLGTAAVFGSNPGLREVIEQYKKFPRRIIAKNALAVKRNYSAEEIGSLWIRLFKRPSTSVKVPVSLHGRLKMLFTDLSELRLLA